MKGYNPEKIKSVFFVFIIGCIFYTPQALSQEGEVSEQKTPEQIELEKAQNEQKIAEAKKLAAEAKLAEETAKKSLKELDLPDSETKGLEGTITASDTAGYMAELLAYESLSDATEKVARSLKDKLGGKQVIISTSFDVGDQFALWNLLDTRADIMM
ncbi:MAG: hypothetical protein DBP02_17795 [gamma proteobacterium symbiont of Ctena orbiculata]|nr:MAG: hypothetical protein DBP02_17795 [gamma proteobacterium symbiont of Ctena orbiculata]